jgi:hypothetical protein
MTITVNAVKRATLKLGRDATVLELLQALTENLGGEWDDARLSVLPGGPTGTTFDDGFTLIASMGSSEPARAERWETEDGEHVAVVDSPGRRTCCCEFTGTDDEVANHLQQAGYVTGAGIWPK